MSDDATIERVRTCISEMLPDALIREIGADHEDVAVAVTRLCSALIAKPASLPFDDDVKDILSFTCISAAPYGRMLREMGHDIPRKIEAEQAAALHWMLSLYLAHGKSWRDEGRKIIEAHIASRTPTPAAPVAT